MSMGASDKPWLVVARRGVGVDEKSAVAKVLAPKATTALIESGFDPAGWDHLDVYEVAAIPNFSAKSNKKTTYEWVIA